MTHEQLYRICLSGHLLPTEARRIAYAKVNQYSSELQNPDKIWESGLVQKALRKRTNTVNNLRKMGVPDRSIIGIISQWYKGKKGDSSSWLFIKDVYNVKPAEIHSYKMAVRARARTLVSKLGKGRLGIPYGRSLPKPTRSTLVVRPQEQFPNF
jgi:hypothetical protein